jgi:hypothetical protein
VPDWDNTESRERDEDAAWRDLVARFDAPLTAQQPVPWPAREDMSPSQTRETDGAGGAEGARGSDGKHRGAEIDGLESEHGRHTADAEPGRHTADAEPGLGAPNGTRESDGLRAEPGGMGGVSGRHGRLEADGSHDPEVIQVPRRIRGPTARGVPVDGTPMDDDEHYIPPAPPPLPKLDPVTKGAWAALFGGPGYLMAATAAGWSVSGLAAFCAVAAFVAGFAILVLRMSG